MLPAPASSARVAARKAGFSMPARATSAQDRPELLGIGVGPGAVDDRVGGAEDAEQRPSATAVLVRALDEPRDLDELDEHAADPGERRDRPERRERVVAGLDLDLGQRLEDRRLADVRRPDQRDLGRALAPHGDRVAVDGVRPHARLLDLRGQPLAEVRVRAVLVVGQLREQRVDLADPLPAFFSYEPSLRQLGEGSMRHRHLDLPLITRDDAARAGLSLRRRHASVPPLPSTLSVEGADQPFCLEIVAAQASSGRGARSSFMAGTS